MVGPRYIVGELIGYALIYSGIARWFLNRRIARGEVTAFFLHDPDKQVFAKVMTTARRWGFEFVNDQQLLDHLNGEKIAERPLLHISVDDGWRNNLTNGAEFAEQNNIPVTYFISTEPMEAGDFWWNRVEDAKTVHQLMNSQNAERLQYLQKHAAQTATRRLAMTADDVARLAKMRHATIGNHTHSHPILGTCTNEEIEFEISEAHRRLTGLLGTNLISFAS